MFALNYFKLCKSLKALINFYFIIFLFLLFLPTEGFLGATGLKNSDFERFYETIRELRSFEMEEIDTDLYYLLEKYYENPLDINKASKKDLLNLSLLNSSQINSIIKRRKKKSLTSLEELVAWGYVSKEEFEILKHFIKIDRKKEKKLPVSFDIINNLVIRHTNGGADGISFWEGRNLHQLTNGREYGSNALRVEHKVQFEIPQKLEANFIIQRDAYEESYIDLIKGALWLQFSSVLENLYLGALSASFGQRLLFSTSTRNAYPYADKPITYNKTSVLDIQRGTTENYLLGVGFDLALGSFFLQSFAGAFNYDGEIVNSDSTLVQTNHFRSIRTDQLHDSAESIRQKNQQWEFLAGVNFEYRWEQKSYVGLGLLYSEFLLPIKPEINDALDFYEFFGKRYFGLSLHWSIEQREMIYFGEIMGYFTPTVNDVREYAFEDSVFYTFHPGAIIGFVYGEKKKLRTQLTIRYYSPYLLDFHSRGFSQGGASRGEYGLYWGLDWKAHEKIKTKLFVDINQSLFPELADQSEVEMGAKFDWKIHSTLKLSFTPTLEIQARDRTPGTINSLKADISYGHSIFFVRLQGLFRQESVTPLSTPYGLGAILELDIFPIDWFYLTTRYLIYNTDVSLYTGNENISALFTGNRVLLGEGWGVDIMTKFTIAKHYVLAIKYGYGHRDRDIDGTKVNTISEEIQAQFRIKY